MQAPIIKLTFVAACVENPIFKPVQAQLGEVELLALKRIDETSTKLQRQVGY